MFFLDAAFSNFPRTLGGKFDQLETEASIPKDLTCRQCSLNPPTVTLLEGDPDWLIGLTYVLVGSFNPCEKY